LLEDINIEEHGDENITFIDQGMQHAGPELYEQYGNLIFQQQKFLAEHTTHDIYWLSQGDMKDIKHILTGTNGVLSIHDTPETTTKGKWILLCQKEITKDNLSKIDRNLMNCKLDPNRPFPSNNRPRRLPKRAERVSFTIKQAYAKRCANFTVQRPVRTKKNPWLQGPPLPMKTITIKRSAPPSPPRSIATTQSCNSEITDLTKGLNKLMKAFHGLESNLETEKQMNKKMRVNHKKYIDEKSNAMINATTKFDIHDHKISDLTENNTNLLQLISTIESNQRNLEIEQRQLTASQESLEQRHQALDQMVHRLEKTLTAVHTNQATHQTTMTTLHNNQTTHQTTLTTLCDTTKKLQSDATVNSQYLQQNYATLQDTMDRFINSQMNNVINQTEGIIVKTNQGTISTLTGPDDMCHSPDYTGQDATCQSPDLKRLRPTRIRPTQLFTSEDESHNYDTDDPNTHEL